MLVIGDVHGQDFWKPIVNKHLGEDYIVFVGDYFDSYSIGSKKILDNFRKIIKLKETYPDKVKLLLGNHDIHYYYLKSAYRSTGFDYTIMSEVNNLFKKNKDLFQATFMYGNTIVSHAGITNKLVESTHNDYLTALDLGWGDSLEHNDISDKLNFLFKISCKSLFYIGEERGGIDPFSGVFWAGMKELTNDYVSGYNQIVGHTRLDEKTIKKYDDAELVFIDTGDKNAYHLVKK
jgi:predicted MPP superfamily phosphohydrolase